MKTLIEVRELSLAYRIGKRLQEVVGSVSFRIGQGEALGLIGESGAGKSTLALGILDLLKIRGGERTRGEIRTSISPREIAYIPQDPLASMDPLFSIGSQMGEITRDEELIREALRRVHLSLGKISLKSYPHELSGGMRQRVLIAMALLHRPKLIVADEPTASLDVLLQAEIMRLFAEIKSQGVSFLFVTHHIPLAKAFCDCLIILRSGKAVEEGLPQKVCENPEHPYTRELMESIPVFRFR